MNSETGHHLNPNHSVLPPPCEADLLLMESVGWPHWDCLSHPDIVVSQRPVWRVLMNIFNLEDYLCNTEGHLDWIWAYGILEEHLCKAQHNTFWVLHKQLPFRSAVGCKHTGQWMLQDSYHEVEKVEEGWLRHWQGNDILSTMICMFATRHYEVEQNWAWERNWWILLTWM